MRTDIRFGCINLFFPGLQIGLCVLYSLLGNRILFSQLFITISILLQFGEISFTGM